MVFLEEIRWGLEMNAPSGSRYLMGINSPEHFTAFRFFKAWKEQSC
jgi:hypothetical protein